MTNYQHILREHNNNKIASRGVNTSFLLFPVRLETKFKEKNIVDINEHDKAYYIFCALWSVLRLLNASSEEKILEKINSLKEALEDIDLILHIDKAQLRILLRHTETYLRSDALKKAWGPLKDILEKIKTSNSISDKKSTNFLNEMDKITRKLVNTIDNPPFLGSKRFDLSSKFSHTAWLRTAKKRFRECYDFLMKMRDEIQAIPEGSITKEQVSKFNDCLKLWEKQLDNVKMKDSKGNTYMAKKNLLAAYKINVNGDLLSQYKSNGGITSGTSAPKQVSNYVKNLYDFVNNRFLPALAQTNFSRLRTLINSKIRRVGPHNNQYVYLQRYTVLASSLMNYYMRYYLDNQVYDREKLERKINSLLLHTYFNYSCEKQWTSGILRKITHKLCIPIVYKNINNNNHSIKRSHISYTRKEKCLCVRIYPDVVTLSQMAKPLNSMEFQSGKDFWLKYTFNDNESYRSSLWLSICDLYVPHRAAFILKKTYPAAFNELCRKAVNYRKNSKNEDDFINDFENNKYFDESIIVDSNDIFTVPVTNLMPERFALHAVLNLSSGKKQTLWRYGHRLPSQLQVGLDLNNLQDAVNESASQKNGQLYLNGDLRWMTDYDVAEKMGMAITLPLKAVQKGRNNTERQFDFDSIFVYGIHEASSDESSKILLDLMEGRLYSNESMEIISSDMPTNILTSNDENHKYDSSVEAQKERFKHQAANCVKPVPTQKEDDAKILENLLCIKEPIFTNLYDNSTVSQKEISNARKVNQYLLELIDNPLVSIINKNHTLRDFFVNDVLPRGPFPFIRISNQPYGILPACDFSKLTYKHESTMDYLKKLVILLTKRWNNIVNNNRVAYDGDEYHNLTDEDYLNILNNTPSTTTFWKRRMISNSDLIRSDYFRNEIDKKQIESIRNILNSGKNHISKEAIKEILLNYDYVPLLDTDDDDVDKSVIMSGENLSLNNLTAQLRKKKGLSQEEISDEKLRQCIIEFFDLFNYRLDAWLTGMLSNKLRNRINKSNHNISLGCFGWIFNLKESGNDNKSKSNEYILAPSINQAITGAVLRSSYNNSLKNGEREYSMSINLSSERVRSAIRIIEGVQNGLSVGCILGSDLERLLHEAYKTDKDCEMDFCIYPLRKRFPLITQNKETENDITVLNGISLLNSYRNHQDNDKINWIRSLDLFDNVSNIQKKEKCLLQLIDRVDDEFDALTDLMISESVYKLTQGNLEAVNALTQAMDEMKNIPIPDVANIPIRSAQIDGNMLVALDVETHSAGDDILSNIEPKVDAWIGEMIGTPSQIGMAFISSKDSVVSVTDYTSLNDLGISPSEIVYLSANKESFNKLLRILYWMKEDVYPTIDTALSSEDLSLQEVQMAASEMRQMLSSSRMLRNDDVVKETGYTSRAEYDTMESSYRLLRDYISDLTLVMQELLSIQSIKQNPSLPNYSTISMTDNDMKKAINMMVCSFRLGQLTALDGIDPSLMIGDKHIINDNKEYLSTVEKQHSFFQRFSNIKDILSKKLEEAKSMVEEVTHPTYKVYEKAIKHMLLSDFLLVPVFKPDEHVDTESLVTQCKSNIFANIDTMGIENLISDMAMVEEPMMHLHQIRMYAKCNDLNIGDILPVQFPLKANCDGEFEWLGTQVSDESMVTDAFVYMVMNHSNMVKSLNKNQKVIAGIVIDHWIERIPYRNQTAAVAFNYDQPDAEAPQTLLLAVSTKDYRRKWSNKMMLNTMKSAVHMIKCRAVNPEMLSNDAWTSGIFPLIEYKDVD